MHSIEVFPGRSTVGRVAVNHAILVRFQSGEPQVRLFRGSLMVRQLAVNQPVAILSKFESWPRSHGLTHQIRKGDRKVSED